MSFKILISDKLGQSGLDWLDTVEDVSYDMITGMSKEELIANIGAYDALIVRSGTRPDAEIIAAGQKLKVIGRAGIGVDNIDIPAATAQGVLVMNTPHANSVATAEQTLALLLAISRHTVQAHNHVAAGEWQRSAYVGTEIDGKTLGIIGFGYIGRLVAKRAQAFGMKIVAYDPYVAPELAAELDATLLSLDDLLAQADYITLHSVVTPETRNMINPVTVSKMKKGMVIINVARGKLIDETALLEGLQNGRIAAAALDVYQNEPPAGSPLIGMPNVIHTPHLGASTKEAQKRVAVEMVQQVVDALRKTEYRNVINKELLD
jgi:D-3-phosphoglycerate dehydrogenase